MIEVVAGGLAALAVGGLGMAWKMWQRAVHAELEMEQFEALYLDALRKGASQAASIRQLEGLYRRALQRSNTLEATNHTMRASIRKMVGQADTLRIYGWSFSRN